jgi:hypothetical protein
VFVTGVMSAPEGGDVRVTARNAKTLEVDTSWGTGGEVRFLAPRKTSKPRAAAGTAVAVKVRPDGGLALVTRVDSVGAATSLVTSWAVTPQGKVGAPIPLAEVDGPMVGGDLVFALAPDGRGFVATSFGGGPGPRHEGQGALLYGLTPQGRLDTSFGVDGHTTEPNIVFSYGAYADSSGWVLTGTHAHAYRVVVTRYTSAGAVDTRFGKDGRQVLTPAEGALEQPRTIVRSAQFGPAVFGSRFWRSEKPQRMRPTLISLDAAGGSLDVRELALADAPIVDVVAAFSTPDGLRVAGFGAKNPLDREPVTFWRPVISVGAPRRAGPAATTVVDGAASSSSPKPTVDPAPSGEAAPPTTMYRWVGRDGVEGYASSLDEVPPEYRKVARPFTPED